MLFRHFEQTWAKGPMESTETFHFGEALNTSVELIISHYRAKKIVFREPSFGHETDLVNPLMPIERPNVECWPEWTFQCYFAYHSVNLEDIVETVLVGLFHFLEMPAIGNTGLRRVQQGRDHCCLINHELVQIWSLELLSTKAAV